MPDSEMVIYCWILGREPDSFFPVVVKSTCDVGLLRKAIIDSEHLTMSSSMITLWKVFIPFNETNDRLPAFQHQKDIGNGAISLQAHTGTRLQNIFPDGPQEGGIHIIVQDRSVTDISNGPKPTTTANFMEDSNSGIRKLLTQYLVNNTQPSVWTLGEHQDMIWEGIRDTVTANRKRTGILEIRKLLTRYLVDDIQPAIWTPGEPQDMDWEYIASLKIPKVLETPSLLLHNIRRSDNPGCIRRLFSSRSSLRFLCNTSGSGKTRLLLQGLCHEWGLYFTARNVGDIGSSDLKEVLMSFEGNLQQLTNDKDGLSKLQSNIRHASNGFDALLYARVSILRHFLEIADANGITENLKERWMLLQVLSKEFFGKDIFAQHTRVLGYFSDFGIDIEYELQLIRQLVNGELSCVVDEAQALTTDEFAFPYCFCGSQGGGRLDLSVPQPILRQLVSKWTRSFPNTIISGTGVSINEVESVFSSVVAKETGHTSETITDIGAFNNDLDIRPYMESYLPKHLIDSNSGKQLLSRVGYWLHGRHRFTATYLSNLIQNHFRSPHRLLDLFIYSLTGFHPLDAVELKEDEPIVVLQMDRVYGFNFSSIKDDALLLHIAGFVFNYIFKGNLKPLGDPYRQLVEYGFARFDEGQGVIADEPLPLLAAVRHFNNTSWNIVYFMTSELCMANDSASGFAFEYFCAYLLGLAFKSPTHLREVFTFVGSNKISEQYAELVAVYKADGKFKITPVDISANYTPGYTLGVTCRTEQETLAWFKDPQRTLFCFPANSIGPDFIMLLRLGDGKLLRVLVQCKHITSRGKISKTDTHDALRTTDPRMFIARREKNLFDRGEQLPLDPGKQTLPVPVGEQELPQGETIEMSDGFYIANTQMNEDLQHALETLGTGTDLAGHSAVLRVFIAFPAPPNEEAIVEAVDKDEYRHPVATVDIKSITKDRFLLGAMEPLERALHSKLSRLSYKRGVDDAYETSTAAAPVGKSRRRKLDTEGA